MKRLYRHGLAEDFEAHSHHVLMQLMQLVRSEDFGEGVTAFVERRAPQFRGASMRIVRRVAGILVLVLVLGAGFAWWRTGQSRAHADPSRPVDALGHRVERHHHRHDRGHDRGRFDDARPAGSAASTSGRERSAASR